jgi:hypothetical protein
MLHSLRQKVPVQVTRLFITHMVIIDHHEGPWFQGGI